MGDIHTAFYSALFNCVTAPIGSHKRVGDVFIEFKEKFLNHIQEYWVDGVYPPQVWNCFRRRVDLTNDNNESHNNYLAHAIKEAHPSPATLTVALVKQLTIAETKVRKIKSGARRVLKQKYKDLNTRRDNIKSMYHTLERIEYLSQIGNIVMHIAHQPE